MTPARRRQQLLDLLRSSAITAHEAAERLGASVRTVYRDVSALRLDGYAIAASSGHGGGLRLDPSSRPRPVRLDPDEVMGLALAVGLLRAEPNLPFTEGASTALGRVLSSLPSERARQIRSLLSRIVVGAPADPATVTDLGAPPLGVLKVFESAFCRRRVLRFRYRNTAGRVRLRTVEPVALLVRAPAWYVIAWDLDANAQRLFRMDRMVSPRMLAQTFPERPFTPTDGQRCPDLPATACASSGISKGN